MSTPTGLLAATRRAAGSRGPLAVTVTAAALAGGVLLILEDGHEAGAGAALGVLGLLAWRWRSDPALDAVLVTGLLYLAVAAGVLGLWPLPGVAAVVVAWLLARRTSRSQLWRSWLTRGTATRELPWLLLTTVVLTALALVLWQRLFDGRLPQGYLDAASGRPLWALVAAGTAFSLVNAAVEEAVFRGVLQTALERLGGPAVAICVQAAAFGLLHVVGIPTGVVGAVMAGSWGVLLGVMRWRTQGLLAPYVAHVAADATIFLMLLPTLRG